MRVSTTNIKTMPKQIMRMSTLSSACKTGLLMASAGAVIAGVSVSPLKSAATSCTSSSDCQQQIDGLNTQNSQAQNSLAVLEAQAGGYQASINALQSQISALQTQISANQ